MHAIICSQTTITNIVSQFTSSAYKNVMIMVNVRKPYVDKLALGFHSHKSLIVGKYQINVTIQANQYSTVSRDIIDFEIIA